MLVKFERNRNGVNVAFKGLDEGEAFGLVQALMAGTSRSSAKMLALLRDEIQVKGGITDADQYLFESAMSRHK